jgi:hypothetical protein
MFRYIMNFQISTSHGLRGRYSSKENKGFALKVEEEEGDSTPIKIPQTTMSIWGYL